MGTANTERPHDTVATALLDAVATGPVLDSGGVDRTTVECAEAVLSINDNVAMLRYRNGGPSTDLNEGQRANAVEEGRRLLAVEGTAWLLEHGHLRTMGEHGLAIGKPIKINGTRYEPGAHREEALLRTMRRTTPKRLDLLRESIATFGDLRDYFPVLVDKHGTVVDGRHRRAIDPNWPAAENNPVSAEDRVAVAVAANRSNAWTKEDYAQLSAHARFVSGQLKKRALASMALRQDHERSNVEIGNILGIDDVTVMHARHELESTSEIQRWRPPRSTKKPRPRKIPEAVEAEIERRVEAGESVSRKQFAEQGVSEHQVQLAKERAEGRVAERRRQAESMCTCPTCGDVHPFTSGTRRPS